MVVSSSLKNIRKSMGIIIPDGIYFIKTRSNHQSEYDIYIYTIIYFFFMVYGSLVYFLCIFGAR